MATHVRKGDMIVVIAGKDIKKTGEVLRVNAQDGKVLVKGINRVWKHVKPSRRYPKGGRIQKEMYISISNVLPVDPKTNQPTRVGFRIGDDGSKQRTAKKSGQTLGVVKKPKQVP
jgi:large subunit ribosomal protein L24